MITVLIGPLCYECINGSSINQCSMQKYRHCDVDNVCMTQISHHDEHIRINKGCIHRDRCIVNIQADDNYTLCCTEDYCNFAPINQHHPYLDRSPPECIDQIKPTIECASSMTVTLGIDSIFIPPINIQWPTVFDNEYNYTITSNWKSISNDSYVLTNKVDQLIWSVVDRNGYNSTCIVPIIYEGMLI